MSYEIAWEPGGLYRKFTGKVSGKEILNSNFELQLDPRFTDVKYIINDFTGITSHSINTTYTETYAKTDDIISKKKGALKIAIVVNKDPLVDLANYYRKEMKNELFECEIFRNIEDARNWTSKK